MTDSISDMLTRIRNAYQAGHKSVNVNHSIINERIVEILAKEGFIGPYKIGKEKPKNLIQIELLYKQGKLPAIDGMKRVSKPGRRIYTRAVKIPRTLGGLGITIISTSKGILTDKQARKEKAGGEVICQIW